MNLLECFSISGLPTTGRTFSYLHLLPLLAISVVLVFQILRGGYKGLRISLSGKISALKTWVIAYRSSKIADVWTEEQEADNIKKQLDRQKKGAAIMRPVILMLACTLGVFAFSYQRYEVVTEHHVLILARLDNGDFAYRSDEKPSGDTYRPCSIDGERGIDVDKMLTQAVTYEADYAVWQERGTCRSILRPEWGFWFRDAHNNFTYVRRN